MFVPDCLYGVGQNVKVFSKMPLYTCLIATSYYTHTEKVCKNKRERKERDRDDMINICFILKCSGDHLHILANVFFIS